MYYIHSTYYYCRENCPPTSWECRETSQISRHLDSVNPFLKKWERIISPCILRQYRHNINTQHYGKYSRP